MINGLSLRHRGNSFKLKSNSKSILNYYDEYNSMEELSNKLSQLSYHDKSNKSKNKNIKNLKIKIKIKNPHKLTKIPIRLRNGKEFYNIKQYKTKNNNNKIVPFISTCSSTKDIKNTFNSLLDCNLNQKDIINNINDSIFTPIKKECELKRYNSTDLMKKVKSLEKKCNSLKDLNNISQKTSKNIKMESNRFKSFYIEKKYENVNILNEINDIKISIDNIQKTINKVNIQTKNYNDKFEKYKNDILLMRNNIFNLNQLNTNLTNETKNYKTVIFLLNKKLNELRKELIFIYEKKFKMGKSLLTVSRVFKK
jgi:hypothetical protein